MTSPRIERTTLKMTVRTSIKVCPRSAVMERSRIVGFGGF